MDKRKGLLLPDDEENVSYNILGKNECIW